MEKLMEISHVGYSYHTMQGETPALSNINFTVHKGDFLAIVGPEPEKLQCHRLYAAARPSV